MRRGQRTATKAFNKPNCKLLEFPTIKLHVLTNVESIDISHNAIPHLHSLDTRLLTSQHALQHLTKVDLAFNSLPDVSSLAPLARSAHHLSELNVLGNPLTQTLNFLFQIVSIFPNISTILSDEPLQVTPSLREKAQEFHVRGGDRIAQFLRIIHRKIPSMGKTRKQSLLHTIQTAIEELGTSSSSILQRNQAIFKTIKLVEDCLTGKKDSWAQQSVEIEVKTAYKVEIRQQLPATEYFEEELMLFYLVELSRSPSICSKVTASILVPDGTNFQLEEGEFETFNFFDVVSELGQKWVHQARGCQNFICESQQNRTLIEGKGEMKRVGSKHTRPLQNCFFGLDSSWTTETEFFIKHRLARLLITALQAQERVFSHEKQVDAVVTLSYSPKGHFGQNSTVPRTEAPTITQRQVRSPNLGQSPKIHHNKFILQSCLQVLSSTIQRIVFRRISSTHLVKLADLLVLEEILTKAIFRAQKDALRQIFECSIFELCLQKKTKAIKLSRIFNSWKQVKQRKLRFLLRLMERKNKREHSFRALYLTQWRVRAAHLATTAIVQQKLFQLQSESTVFQDIGELVRRRRKELQRQGGRARKKRNQLGSAYR